MNSGPSYTLDENLVFDVGASNLPGGVAVWTGNSNFTYYNLPSPSPTTVSLPVRFTLTLSGTGAADGLIDSTNLLGIDPAFDDSQSVVAKITGDFSAHWLAEAQWGATWTPVLTLFNNTPTVAGDEARTNVGGAFYSTEVSAVPEPGSAVTLALLLTSSIGLHRQRRKGKR